MRILFFMLCFLAQTICFSQKQLSIDSLLFSIKVTAKSSANSSFGLLLQTEKKFSNKNNILNATFTKNGKNIFIEIKDISEPQIKEYAVGYAVAKFDLGNLKNSNYSITITKSNVTCFCKLIVRKSYYKLIITKQGFLSNEPCFKQSIY